MLTQSIEQCGDETIGQYDLIGWHEVKDVHESIDIPALPNADDDRHCQIGKFFEHDFRCFSSLLMI